MQKLSVPNSEFEILAVIQTQLEDYNRHDADAFASHYHPQAEIFRLREGERLFAGRTAIRDAYAKLFVQASPHAEIASRMVLGNFVIDSERIMVSNLTTLIEAVVIYEVQGSLILHVWIINKPAGEGD